MTDRELLVLAAKAAGIADAEYKEMFGWGELRHGYGEAIWSGDLFEQVGSGYWNPLLEDGDALRLAVKLKLTDLSMVVGRYVMSETHREGDDIYATTRRAITRAAAALGEKK